MVDEEEEARCCGHCEPRRSLYHAPCPVHGARLMKLALEQMEPPEETDAAD